MKMIGVETFEDGCRHYRYHIVGLLDCEVQCEKCGHLDGELITDCLESLTAGITGTNSPPRGARGINRCEIALLLVDIAHFVMFDESRDDDEEQQRRPPNEERLSLR